MAPPVNRTQNAPPVASPAAYNGNRTLQPATANLLPECLQRSTSPPERPPPPSPRPAPPHPPPPTRPPLPSPPSVYRPPRPRQSGHPVRASHDAHAYPGGKPQPPDIPRANAFTPGYPASGTIGVGSKRHHDHREPC